MWRDYVFGKQTIAELAQRYDTDRRLVRKALDAYVAPTKIHNPRPIHLVVDATYFGDRKEDTSWCVVVARDPTNKENLLWSFEETETTSVYTWIRETLEGLGYTILSVTGDGFSGIKAAFHGIPYQMCHVHMERLVTRKTTKNPQTEAGRVLLALARSLHNTDSKTFTRRLTQYIERYRDLLNEKTYHPTTHEWWYTHENLRGGIHRLIRHQKHLFTFEQNKHIPKTTNSLEGHFSHVNQKVGSHNGLSRKQKERVSHSILLASTTAPSLDKLNEIL